MSHMFERCSSLKELTLSNFKTNDFVDMNDMLEGCFSLKKLNCENQFIKYEFKQLSKFI